MKLKRERSKRVQRYISPIPTSDTIATRPPTAGRHGLAGTDHRNRVIVESNIRAGRRFNRKSDSNASSRAQSHSTPVSSTILR